MLHRLVVHASSRNFRFVGFEGEFKGCNSQIRIECPKHGQFIISHSRFLHKNQGCAKCAGNVRIDKTKGLKEINRLCENTDYSFVKWCEDTGKTKFQIACAKHGLRTTTYYDFVVKGKRCKACTGKEKYTTGQASRLILEKYKLTPFIFIGFSGETYEGRETRVRMFCANHGEWDLSFVNATSRFSKCPGCARGRFDENKQAYLYALMSEEGNSVKIGITNNHVNRFRDLRSSTPFGFNVIKIIKFKKGREAYEKEQFLHSIFQKSGFNGFSGCTEWLQYDTRLLTMLDEMDRTTSK